MNLVDTHVHLYDKVYEEDLEEVLKRAYEAGVKQFYLPAIDSSTHEKMISLQKSNPKVFYFMMGLHPAYVKKETFEDELSLVKKYLKENEFAAIGEIGIDLYWNKENVEIQKQAFLIQIKLAKKYKLPIVIHAREAFDEIFEILDRETDKNLRGIFHCFSGGLSEAKRILNYGMKLGIGGIVTFKNSKLGEFLDQIPLDHIVLETDGPYLSPTPNRGKRNEPAYLDLITEKLSTIYRISKGEIALQTTKNANEILKNIKY